MDNSIIAVGMFGATVALGVFTKKLWCSTQQLTVFTQQLAAEAIRAREISETPVLRARLKLRDDHINIVDIEICNVGTVSYTHLTLPTIYSV